MHKVISIREYAATRDVTLENTETGTIDVCFDDSDCAGGDEWFDFMEIGKEYDCKIALFGDMVLETGGEIVLCKIVCRHILVGTTNMVKVLINNDEYYIFEKELSELEDVELFYYSYTRKDLIQVNNVIHVDLLQWNFNS